MCRWTLPAQSFSGLSPLGLATVFYCLRFETSLFVASYNSQGHGEGIHFQLRLLASVVLITPLHGPSRKHRFEQYIYCCMYICCSGNVFTELLPINSSTRYIIYRNASFRTVVCLLTDINYCRHNYGLAMRMLSRTPIILNVILESSRYHVTVIIICFLCLLMCL
jgi:hypothetical protein